MTGSMHRLCVRRGMTLFEVIAAIAIFGLVAITIFSVFRIAVRSMHRYNRSVNAFQSSRVTLDLLMRDLRAAVYQKQDEVNFNFNNNERNLRHRIEMDRQRVLQVGAEPMFKDPGDDEFQDVWGELNEQGLPIDLSFQGVNSGELDSLAFVRFYASGREPLPGVGPYRHLGRIEYTVENGVLYRSEGSVRLPDFDIYGEYMEMTESPKEIVAENVVVFDLQFGYWHKDQWEAAPDWNSAESYYRNPFKDYDVLRGDPALETFFRSDNNVAPDGMPGYVDVTLGVSDKDSNGEISNVVRYFSTRIMLPAGFETFRPFTQYEKIWLREAMVTW